MLGRPLSPESIAAVSELGNAFEQEAAARAREFEAQSHACSLLGLNAGEWHCYQMGDATDLVSPPRTEGIPCTVTTLSGRLALGSQLLFAPSISGRPAHCQLVALAANQRPKRRSPLTTARGPQVGIVIPLATFGDGNLSVVTAKEASALVQDERFVGTEELAVVWGNAIDAWLARRRSEREAGL